MPAHFGQPGEQEAEASDRSSKAQFGQSPDRVVSRDQGQPDQEKKDPLLPTLSLPKGGGAISSMGEKFQANAFTGTGSYSFPVFTSPSRGGVELLLSYNSGSGNGPFGLGWSLSPASIGRKTDRGLPRYMDSQESDTFMFTGAEDLVPMVAPAGGWAEGEVGTPWTGAEGGRVQEERDGYRVLGYRPRVEAGFARIERWVDLASNATHWRVTTNGNVTSLFGQGTQSRIADPADPSRVLRWLLDEVRDGVGNVTQYEYKEEDREGVGVGPWELGRGVEQAQRYLKRIRYGKRTVAADSDFMFEVVFDYGEHGDAAPAMDSETNVGLSIGADAVQSWPARPDTFSNYRGGFDLRTRRLCRRVLMFHHFSEEFETPEPLLVASTDFTYDDNGIATQLVGVNHRRYVRDDVTGSYTAQSMPPAQMGYSPAVLGQTCRDVDSAVVRDLGAGIDGSRIRLTDLDGEGVPGILVTDGRGWQYKEPRLPGASGSPNYGPTQTLRTMPTTGVATARLMDLDGDGRLSLVDFDGRRQYARADGSWEPAQAIGSMPTTTLDGPRVQMTDVTGNGLTDLLIDRGDHFVLYKGKGHEGFEGAVHVPKPSDEREGPQVVYSSPQVSVVMADMTGDGLSDIVCVRFGGVVYWPNLGYGRFGARVMMAMPGGPLERMEMFRADRVRMADIDGSGTSDLVYFGAAGAFVRLNASGNRFEAPQALVQCPRVTALSHVDLSDLTGSGTADLVWSTSAASELGRKLRYIELMPEGKPYLLTSVRNNMGAETRVRYAPSTRFYLQDKAAGRPWITRLAFPVQVIERTEVFNHVTGHRFASTFRYRHGYFDGAEREFRGFGYVEQRDTESFEHFGEARLFPSGHRVQDEALHVPPVVTRTWFHTGAFLGRDVISAAYASEYWQGDADAARLADTVAPVGASPAEVREAVRALKGATLRSEVYAEDGAEAQDRPYAVTEGNMSLRIVQPKGERAHAVVTAFAREQLSYHYERDPSDPRVSHGLMLEVDAFGTVTRSAAVAYARRTTPVAEVAAEQSQVSVVVSDVQVQHQAFGMDRHLVGVPIEQRSYELRNAVVAAGEAVFELEALRAEIADAPEVAFEAGATAAVDLRLLSRTRSLYYDDDLVAGLPLGDAGRRALPFERREAAFSPALLESAMHPSFDSDMLLSAGGYLLEDGLWWARSGRQVFDPAQFYARVQAHDAFGNPPARIEYAYSAFATRSVDPLGNEAAVELDYRTLSPWRMTDPNGNVAEVAFDTLGSVRATALVGNPALNEGDTLADPTSRSSYNQWSFLRGEGPNWARSESRETHQDPGTRWIASVSYSDGGGNVVQAKVQAEAGLAPQRDADGALVLDDDGELVLAHTETRWIGNGRVIVDNKGNPIKQYEPFFSDRDDYESEAVMVEQGVTALTHYDPMGRVMRMDMPDGTLSRVEFTPWVSRTFDANDTVLESEWHARMLASGQAPQVRAANLAAEHANTPSTVHLDHLGRPVLTDAHNIDADNSAEHIQTRVVLDVVGNTLEVIDALGNTAESRVFGMQGQTLRSDSADAASRWGMGDVGGGPLWARNSRDFVSTFRFDEARRTTHALVTDAADVTMLVGRTVYGEDVPNAQDANLLGQAWRVYDSAGLAHSTAFDFKGNPVAAWRRLARAYTETPNWSAMAELATEAELDAAGAALLESETFAVSATFDALGRPVTQTSPDGSVVRLSYNEAGLLEAVSANVRAAELATTFVTGIAYDAKGQRERIAYGNGTETTYAHDRETFRLTRLRTTRTSDARVLQDLAYAYDPVGNITEVGDGAQDETFFNNAQVSADQQFVYDAVYRLTRATGREHALVGDGQLDHRDPTHADVFAADGQALRAYTETFGYDVVGNILRVQHAANNGGSWTRRYQYDTATTGNRLLATSLPGDQAGQFTAAYGHDVHGNMTSMPHLETVEWDFGDRMASASTTVDGSGSGPRTYFAYDGGGQRVRKVQRVSAGRANERVYLGAFEVYREHEGLEDGNAALDIGTVALERETLHISDDSGRICLVETRTVVGGAAVAEPANVQRYQYGNHLGSAALELDGSAELVSYEEFHPYGTSAYRAANGAVEVSPKRYRYTGKERDEETGLYYHGARYYACWLGRWTASDPIGLSGGLNLYEYAASSPVVLSDPSGEAPVSSNQNQLDQQAKANRPSAEEFAAYEEGAANYNTSVDTYRALQRVSKRGDRQVDGIRRELLATQAVLQEVIVDLSDRRRAADEADARTAEFEQGGQEWGNISGRNRARLGAAVTLGITVTLALVLGGGGVVGELLIADIVQSSGRTTATGEGSSTVLAGGVTLASEAVGNSVPDARIHGEIADVVGPLAVGAVQVGRAAGLAGTSTLANGTGATAAGGGALGDLTAAETRQIQGVVDQAGRPLEVVGSAARGQRRGVGTDLPIGKGPGTRSDIDFTTAGSSRGNFQGLEGRLPSADPKAPVLQGTADPFQGPSVRFEPGRKPVFVPGKTRP